MKNIADKEGKSSLGRLDRDPTMSAKARGKDWEIGDGCVKWIRKFYHMDSSSISGVRGGGGSGGGGGGGGGSDIMSVQVQVVSTSTTTISTASRPRKGSTASLG